MVALRRLAAPREWIEADRVNAADVRRQRRQLSRAT